MFAEEQDIINLRNIVYKDAGRIDLSLTGHPVLIIKVTDTHFYYLTISSSSNRTSHRNTHFINLKNIYKQEIANYAPYGFVNDYLFKNIITKLKYYQENITEDELYSEIKNDI